MADETWVVTMPKLGETVTEGTIGSWLKNVGDTVEFDDPLFEVSTDKVDSEIPSPYDGVILEIMVAAGETVPIGTELIRIGAPGSSPGAAPASDAPASAEASAAAPASAEPPPTPAGEPQGEAEGAAIVHDITMPKLGETVAEGTIGAWLKNVGDSIEFDDPLMEVSTDKVDSEIPSPYDGVLVEVLVQAGDTVPIGTVVARVSEPGASVPAGGGTAAAAPSPAPAAPATAPTAAPAAGPTAGAGGAEGKHYSPIVRRLAAEGGLDLTAVAGTGAGGRIRREDVEAALAGRPAAAAPAASAPAAAAPAAAAPAAKPASAPAAAPAGVSDPRDEVVPLSRMRLAVAAGMVASVAAAPQVWTSILVDYENVEKFRKQYKESFKKETGASLSYLPFISRAVCDALRQFPAVNASIDVPNKQMTMHPYVNLGIAVDMDGDGLIVPVVENADQLNIRGVATQIKDLAAAGRAKKLGAEKMKGSTFTITNPGPFQSYASAPIINQPNVGILCTDGVTRQPVAVGDTIAIHSVGVIGLVYDHRAFDGSTASKFLMAVRDSLQNRDWSAELG